MKKLEKIKTAYVLPNEVTPTRLIEFDPKICDGCVGLPEPLCIAACSVDALFPNPEKGKPPIQVYPDECGGCQCGCCVGACPLADKGAIKMNWAITHRPRWKRKETGEHYRVGMKNPPPPYTKPPVSGWGWAGKYPK
ncbi:MAG: hypothetical protein QXV01_08680 [Candidatus Bathyarchaeia archaeon]